MKHKMRDEKFKLIRKFDEIRWSNKKNYNDINYVSDKLTDGQKILTHWISYIADRQMPYKTVWDVGGFVFSNLVADYESKNVKDLLKMSKKNIDDSYIQQYKNGKKTGYMFLSKEDANNLIKDDYESFVEGNKVKFIPRFYPSDYVSICYTLGVLEKDYDK